MRIETLNDGAKKFTFRQSGINTFMLCPERARVEWFEGVREEEPSDAAATGTALHSMIEADLAVGNEWGLAEATDYAHFKFDQLVEEGVRFVQSDVEHARIYLTNMTAAWLLHPLSTELRSDRSNLALEWNFNVPFDKDADGNELWLEGQADCLHFSPPEALSPIGRRVAIYDWKTAASEYKGWEKQRWAKQPTVYTYAVDHNFTSNPSFEYVVFSKKVNSCDIQILEVTRDASHWQWLRQQLWSITRLDPTVGWPLVDEHALCSRKWCSNFDRCKGRLVTV